MQPGCSWCVNSTHTIDTVSSLSAVLRGAVLCCCSVVAMLACCLPLLACYCLLATVACYCCLLLLATVCYCLLLLAVACFRCCTCLLLLLLLLCPGFTESEQLAGHPGPSQAHKNECTARQAGGAGIGDRAASRVCPQGTLRHLYVWHWPWLCGAVW